jgi:hypothetical protein
MLLESGDIICKSGKKCFKIPQWAAGCFADDDIYYFELIRQMIKMSEENIY